jgi:uncharacterized membrane protein YgdD (TMEM256/DUF423 family)
MKGKVWITSGALLAAVAVTAGAVGTHVLKEIVKLDAPALETYDVAVRYQMFHALGMILVGLLAARGTTRLVPAAGIAFGLGILLFSGGIYAWLATDMKPFVQVVPIGGMAWIIGWLLLAVGALVARTP